MNDSLELKNNIKEVRTEKKLSQSALANLVGVSRNTISSIETGQFNPTAKLALLLCIALDKKFEELFYFKNGISKIPIYLSLLAHSHSVPHKSKSSFWSIPQQAHTLLELNNRKLSETLCKRF